MTLHVTDLVIVVAPHQGSSRPLWAASLDLEGALSPAGYGISAWEAVGNLIFGLTLAGTLERCFAQVRASEEKHMTLGERIAQYRFDLISGGMEPIAQQQLENIAVLLADLSLVLEHPGFSMLSRSDGGYELVIKLRATDLKRQYYDASSLTEVIAAAVRDIKALPSE